MEKKLKFVKAVLWAGIILDGVNVILYMLPNLILSSMGLPDEMITPVAIYLLFHAGIFMLAWTILLLWTLQAPVERRFIFLLTVLVTVGMEASAIYLLTVEGVLILNMLPLVVLPVVVGTLFAAGYFVAGSLRYDSALSPR